MGSTSAVSRVLSAAAVAAVLLSCLLASSRARAFGGLWSSRSERVELAGEQILFIDDPGPKVTAIVRVAFRGPAQAFAWVIPVPSKPSVGVSSRTVFERLAAATSPQYWREVGVEGTCDDGASAVGGDGGAAGGGQVPGGPFGAAPEVLERGTVGPFDYVTLAVDPSAEDAAEVATAWLGAEGYDLSGLEGERLRPYLEEGFELVAIKLAAGADAGDVRPVVLTYEGERPTIPLRPSGGAAQDGVGIQVWVIGPAQAVPQGGYPSLVLDDALIDWSSGPTHVAGTLPSGGAGSAAGFVPAPSNYDALVAAAVKEAGGRGFVTELGAPASQFREAVWSPTDALTLELLTGQSFEDGLDLLIAARESYATWDGWAGAVEGAAKLPAGVTLEALLRDPERFRGMVEIDAAELLRRVREDVVQPVADAGARLQAAPYLTRLSSAISAEAMTVDPAFDYNADLAQVGNVHLARQRFECGAGIARDAAPWRIELPQGGVVLGEGEAWPWPLGTLPASLAVVMLGTRGAGTIVTDNRDAIGEALFEVSGMEASESARPVVPQHGVTIGGVQRVTRQAPSAAAGEADEPEPTQARRAAAQGGGCSVATVVEPDARSRASWVACALAALALGVRRRRALARDRRARLLDLLLAGCAYLLLASCADDGGTLADGDAGPASEPFALTREQLKDPETCQGCHPKHYREWSSSMHAYAARDPVFLAMNARGQRETHGELGDFCIRCHAPMTVVDGTSRDGLDLPELPDHERGVSCYFCHNVEGVEGEHNAALRTAGDTTMRGPIRDPMPTSAHGARYAETFDGDEPDSSAMCGACHDIVTPSGVHLERTFEEYRSGIFSKSATGAPPAFDSCVGCHMPPRKGIAAAGGGMRTLHEHVWPGIDVALTDFPHRDAMRSAVEDCQLGLGVSFFTLEVTPPDLFTFQIETAAGHNTPSGAAQDRRMWLELAAYDADGALMADASSGMIADDELEEQPEDDPRHDPRLVAFRDRIYGERGEPVHMFWDAAKSSAHPYGYESSALPVSTTTYLDGKHAVVKQYRVAGADGLPARVTARLRMRPIGLDVLRDLVDSGDLEPAIAAEMPTFTFGAQIEWTPDAGVTKTIAARPVADCNTYHCRLDPTSEDCR